MKELLTVVISDISNVEYSKDDIKEVLLNLAERSDDPEETLNNLKKSHMIFANNLVGAVADLTKDISGNLTKSIWPQEQLEYALKDVQRIKKCGRTQIYKWMDIGLKKIPSRPNSRVYFRREELIRFFNWLQKQK